MDSRIMQSRNAELPNPGEPLPKPEPGDDPAPVPHPNPPIKPARHDLNPDQR